MRLEAGLTRSPIQYRQPGRTVFRAFITDAGLTPFSQLKLPRGQFFERRAHVVVALRNSVFPGAVFLAASGVFGYVGGAADRTLARRAELADEAECN